MNHKKFSKLVKKLERIQKEHTETESDLIEYDDDYYAGFDDGRYSLVRELLDDLGLTKKGKKHD